MPFISRKTIFFEADWCFFPLPPPKKTHKQRPARESVFFFSLKLNRNEQKDTSFGSQTFGFVGFPAFWFGGLEEVERLENAAGKEKYREVNKSQGICFPPKHVINKKPDEVWRLNT